MKRFGYSFLVLLGACSYGVHGAIIKMASNAGYSSADIVSAQYVTGVLFLAAAWLFMPKRNMSIKQWGELLSTGVFLSLTALFYAISIADLSASAAVILLFQFVWMGIVIESIHMRKLPEGGKVISVVLIWAGTFLAARSSEAIEWFSHPVGVLYGLLSGLTFALFIFFSGRSGKGIPAVQRSLIMSIGGLLVILIMNSPSFLFDGTFAGGLWEYGILNGLLGAALPVLFFAAGTPHIGSGTATICGAAELPAAIVAAWLLIGEQVTTVQTAGVLIILLAIMLPQWKQQRAAYR
jgi:drug/metabolite transporter (DMT)-like permease